MKGMINLATHGLGTTLTWDSESVLGLTSINGFGVTVDTVDVTNHLSTSGYEEVVAGIKRTKEITLEGFFNYADSTGQVAMASDIGSSKTWLITFPAATGTTWTGTGILTDFHVGTQRLTARFLLARRLKRLAFRHLRWQRLPA